jgi:membrane protease YdiL (CAAX protease family)
LPGDGASLIYAFVWTTGFGGFYNKPFVDLVAKDFGFRPLPQWATIAFYFFFTATIAVIKDFATVLGEEIGWRGFLVPELAKRHSFVATSLISGIIWALWHYPILLFELVSQPDSCLVLPAALHHHGHHNQLPLDLDASEIRKYLALRFSARRSQHVHPEVF